MACSPRYSTVAPSVPGWDSPARWESLRGQIFLSSDAFIDSMQQIVADQTTVSEIPRVQRRPLARPLEFTNSEEFGGIRRNSEDAILNY